MNPEITVLMAVYNGEKYLVEAIESILGQTVSSFEFLIIDDASTDRTPDILETYAQYDQRIRIHRNQSNLRLAAALNIGLKLARSSLIARMDADDVAYPNRLQVQLDFLKNHPAITVCGSSLVVYEYPKQCWNPPQDHPSILSRMLFECSLYHPTTVFRKNIIVEYGGYNSNFSGAEDYDLWQRISKSATVRFANLAEPLLRYRVHPKKNRRIYKDAQNQLANQVRLNYLAQLGLEPNMNEFTCHMAFSNPMFNTDTLDLVTCAAWLNRIEAANRERKLIPIVHLRKELEYRWLNLCLRVARERLATAFTYISEPLAPHNIHALYNTMRMIWRSTKSYFN